MVTANVAGLPHHHRSTVFGPRSFTVLGPPPPATRIPIGNRLYKAEILPITEFLTASTAMMNLFSFNIENLRLWLTWELSASVLFALSFFRIATLYILGPVILLFIPVLVGTLYLEKRFGWLIFFGLFVLIPSLLIYFIIDFGSWSFALNFVPLGLFLFYCFLLRLTITTWD